MIYIDENKMELKGNMGQLTKDVGKIIVRLMSEIQNDSNKNEELEAFTEIIISSIIVGNFTNLETIRFLFDDSHHQIMNESIKQIRKSIQVAIDFFNRSEGENHDTAK